MKEPKPLNPVLIIDVIWHWLVEDHLPWDFCSGIVKQDYDLDISAADLKKLFYTYFRDLTGLFPYTTCPLCGMHKVIPRKGTYGYFLSCSDFPNCQFIANGCFITKKNSTSKGVLDADYFNLTREYIEDN